MKIYQIFNESATICSIIFVASGPFLNGRPVACDMVFVPVLDERE